MYFESSQAKFRMTKYFLILPFLGIFTLSIDHPSILKYFLTNKKSNRFWLLVGFYRKSLFSPFFVELKIYKSKMNGFYKPRK